MEKQQVFYIHGGGAYTNYDAFLHDLETMEPRDLPWSESKNKWTHTFAEDLGPSFEVFMPMMPNKWNAKYEEWKLWFERHFEYIHENIILVGVSLGAMFFVRYLSENQPPFSIKHVFLLAGAYENIDVGKLKEDGGDFFANVADIPKISEKVRGITIMHSKDDFVVSYEHALKYKDALPGAELVTFEDKTHFLVPEFPELLTAIRAVSR